MDGLLGDKSDSLKQKNFKTLDKALFPLIYACLKKKFNLRFLRGKLFFFPFTGEKPDPDQTFKLTSLQNFSSCLPNSCTTLVSNHSLSHRQPETVLTETPQDTIVSVLYTSVQNIVKMKINDLN